MPAPPLLAASLLKCPSEHFRIFYPSLCAKHRRLNEQPRDLGKNFGILCRWISATTPARLPLVCQKCGFIWIQWYVKMHEFSQMLRHASCNRKMSYIFRVRHSSTDHPVQILGVTSSLVLEFGGEYLIQPSLCVAVQKWEP